MTWLAAGVVGLSALAVPSGRARELVRQLGSEAYRDRDRAAQELRRMGRLSLSALSEAAAASDPEVRARVAELLPAAEADDMAARVAAFRADPDGPHELPGWAEFRAATGNDHSARELFVEVVKNPDNHPLLLACQRPADQLDRVLLARRRGILSRPSPEVLAGLANMAVLFLTESLVPDRTGNPGARFGDQYDVVYCFHDPKAQDALAGRGPVGPAFRWLETRDGDGVRTALYYARRNSLGNDVVCRLAAQVLAQKPGKPTHKAEALNILAECGKRDQLPTIVGQFADATVVYKGVPNPIGVAAMLNLGADPDDTQLRDVALRAAVKMTGQEPKDYGLESKPGGGDPTACVSNLYPLRFRPTGTATADQKRAAAFKKWDEWAAKNKK